jgi:hypothetical protein
MDGPDTNRAPHNFGTPYTSCALETGLDGVCPIARRGGRSRDRLDDEPCGRSGPHLTCLTPETIVPKRANNCRSGDMEAAAAAAAWSGDARFGQAVDARRARDGPFQAKIWHNMTPP